MDVITSDSAKTGGAVLVQADIEGMHLTTEILQAILQACTTNESQNVRNVIIQFNQPETESIPVCSEHFIIQTFDEVNSFHGENSADPMLCGEPQPADEVLCLERDSQRTESTDKHQHSVITNKCLEKATRGDGVAEHTNNIEYVTDALNSTKCKHAVMLEEHVATSEQKLVGDNLKRLLQTGNGLADSNTSQNQEAVAFTEEISDTARAEVNLYVPSNVDVPHGCVAPEDNSDTNAEPNMTKSEGIKRKQNVKANKPTAVTKGENAGNKKDKTVSGYETKRSGSKIQVTTLGSRHHGIEEAPLGGFLRSQVTVLKGQRIMMTPAENKYIPEKEITENRTSPAKSINTLKQSGSGELINKVAHIQRDRRKASKYQFDGSDVNSSQISHKKELADNDDIFVVTGVHADEKNINLKDAELSSKVDEDAETKNVSKKGDAFTCETCGKVFDRKFNLDRHLKSKRVHQKRTKRKYVPKPASCEICSKTFHSTSAMCLHRKKHDESLRYSCPHCDHKFTQKGNLRLHIKTIHKGIKDFVCEKCGDQFSNAASLSYHNQKIHLEEEMKQRYCQLKFVKTCHQNITANNCPEVHVLNQVIYRCPVCPRTFVKVFAWFAHLNLHLVADDLDGSCKERMTAVIEELQGEDHVFNDIVLFPCTYCDYVAFCKSDIVIHLNRHSKDKPYLCKYCDQTFASSSERVVHEQYHTKKFRHQCHICNSGFPLVSQLKSHLLKQHQVSVDELPGSKGYKCETCGKEFIYKALYKKHVMYTHEGLRNFKCDVCDKTFKTKYAAKLHLCTHTRECRHTCQTCGKSFTDPSNLIHHIRRLHKHPSSSLS